MKKKNIFIAGLALIGLTACSDFMEPEAPSSVTDDYVFSNINEANSLLNGVYAALANNNTYGNAYLTTYDLNSDVEFTTSSAESQSASHNEYKLFDAAPDASGLMSTWNAAYTLIERANNFVNGAEKSGLKDDEDMLQMIGEAKCMRAMQYLDLTIMFGDVPFSLTRSYDAESMVMPQTDRDVILTTLINDLRAAAPKMKLSSNVTQGIERCTKEFAWALIARMALYRGGYSLHPDVNNPKSRGTMKRADDYREYYQMARTYCDSVMKAGTHSLTKDWYQVFIDECNYKTTNNDDPIFEIPFAINVSGSIGYAHGPKGDETAAGGTEAPNYWGTSGGNVRLNAFFRFTYDPEDVRRDAIGYWRYDGTGQPVLLNDYNNYCNKWSKFWDENHRQGNNSSGNTGINFPYMRYADVLLMFAETENELNGGPTAAAKNALKQVRERAFRGATNAGAMVNDYVDAANTKEAFFELLFNERAWEFAGEGLRWKDLVRWNRYAETVFVTFWTYYGKATDDYTYDIYEKFDSYPTDVYYKIVNPGDELYPTEYNYPNKTLPVLKFYKYESDTLVINNLWENWGLNGKYMPSTAGADAWTYASWFDWQDDTGAKPQVRCSLRGYIYIDVEGNKIPADMPELSAGMDFSTLPPVRYILPIPQDAVTRSNGVYKNYYGY